MKETESRIIKIVGARCSLSHCWVCITIMRMLRRIISYNVSFVHFVNWCLIQGVVYSFIALRPVLIRYPCQIFPQPFLENHLEKYPVSILKYTPPSCYNLKRWYQSMLEIMHNFI